MGGWAELPNDLINAIAKRPETGVVDYVRLGAVCVAWNLTIPKKKYNFHRQIPLLMLPFDNKEETSRGFYSILEDTVYHLFLPETRGMEFRGSSYGWVVTVDKSPELNLFNPFSKVRIALPPVYTFPHVMGYRQNENGYECDIVDKDGYMFSWNESQIQLIFIQKIVLSSPPPNDYLAMAIYGENYRLAFCRSSDKKWTAAETGYPYISFSDVIFYEDKIYALTMNCDLLVSDMVSLPKFTHIPLILPEPVYMRANCMFYMVGSSNGLMMVARFSEVEGIDLMDLPEVCCYRTKEFRIYLLKSNSNSWIEITTLGDNVMFLGYNASVLIPSQDFPKLKGNCVYFSDNQIELHYTEKYGGFDNGVFHLEDRSIKEFEELNLDNVMVWPPPAWVIPNA